MQRELAELRRTADPTIAGMLTVRGTRLPGLDDGVILPPDELGVESAAKMVQAAAVRPQPLRGLVNVLVVLVETPDRSFDRPAQEIHDLFFSRDTLPHGSVSEYYTEVSGGAIEIAGRVVGPITLARDMRAYAGGSGGRNPIEPNSQTVAAEAINAVSAQAIDLRPFDNDGNGFVDAFVLVHAGPGSETTGNQAEQIWSHKWTLRNPVTAGGAKLFAYLTVPEDALIGVCCHELGHLLFSWPDLYDTDESSQGVGNWCLMGGGSWNGFAAGARPGEVPAHPSAWCKKTQGWVAVSAPNTNGAIAVEDVQASRQVVRLWKDGDLVSKEYFLVENRRRSGYDAGLPGEGLLVWHVDEAVDGNTNESHYKVALLQADGKRELERSVNRGDGGDPFPGSANTTSLSASTEPSSRSYAGADTFVSLANISPPSGRMQVDATVRQPPPIRRRPM